MSKLTPLEMLIALILMTGPATALATKVYTQGSNHNNVWVLAGIGVVLISNGVTCLLAAVLLW